MMLNVELLYNFIEALLITIFSVQYFEIKTQFNKATAFLITLFANLTSITVVTILNI